MSTSAVAVPPAASPAEVIEQVIARGDLAKLSPEERARYYVAVCESCGLNPLTKPFDYIVLNGRLTLYPTRGAADQLRAIHRITCEIVSREQIGDVYFVHVRVAAPDGRRDEDIGAVPVKGLSAADFANAVMKAITKAKRRATLSLLGLNMPDETEVETIPGARSVRVDVETGEILEAPAPAAAQPEPGNGHAGHERSIQAAPERVGSRETVLRRLFAHTSGLVGEESHELLRGLARAAFGRERLRETSDEELGQIAAAVTAFRGAEALRAFRETALAIASAGDHAVLGEIAMRLQQAAMPEAARALLRLAWKRRHQDIVADEAGESGWTEEQAGPEEPVVSWAEVWRRLEPLGIRGIAEAARYLGVPRKQIEAMTPDQLLAAVEAARIAEDASALARRNSAS